MNKDNQIREVKQFIEIENILIGSDHFSQQLILNQMGSKVLALFLCVIHRDHFNLAISRSIL